MRTITVKVADLKTQLNKNMIKHRDTFDVAMDIFRNRAIETLDEQIATIRGGGLPDKYLRLPIPEEHTSDYKRALEMLHWHTEDTISLTEDEFAQYVQDDWGWRQSFLSNTTSYVQ